MIRNARIFMELTPEVRLWPGKQSINFGGGLQSLTDMYWHYVLAL